MTTHSKILTEQRRASRELSNALRHKPEALGLVLDKNGWASVSRVLDGLRVKGYALTPQQLQELVAANDKKRFSLSPDGLHIRANQGHTVTVDLGLTDKKPPPVLYHGTVADRLASIRRQGLLPMGRHAVHLSATRETALQVGSRRGRPVVLVIETYPLVRDGAKFQVSANGVWLTETVPARYIRFPN